jgi:hypothetical protein
MGFNSCTVCECYEQGLWRTTFVCTVGEMLRDATPVLYSKLFGAQEALTTEHMGPDAACARINQSNFLHSSLHMCDVNSMRGGFGEWLTCTDSSIRADY